MNDLYRIQDIQLTDNYAKAFDLVILNDGNLEIPNTIVKYIKNSSDKSDENVIRKLN